MPESFENLLDNPRALLTALHRAAVQGANPFLRTHQAATQWLAKAAVAPGAPVHIFALGKAAATMAAGATRALTEHGAVVAGGVVVVAAPPALNATPEQGGELPAVLELRVGDHPVPDVGSLAAADVIARRVKAVREGEIAMVLISGGATSLCAAPCDELRALTDLVTPAHELITQLIATLHGCGLAIHEMNAIRRRLLRWGAGRLAVALHEHGAASIPVFAVSDVIGDDPSVIGSGPCSPDPMTDAEFLAMLDAYDLRAKIPRELSFALGLEGAAHECVVPPHPNHEAFSRVRYSVVARNTDACEALADRARILGITEVTVVDSPLSGEAETLGHTIASLAMRAADASSQSQLVIFGGEPTVVTDLSARDVFGDEDFEQADEARAIAEYAETRLKHAATHNPNHVLAPLGGRMQALALAAALALEGSIGQARDDNAFRITILAAGTDGRDGPTDACGAIVDVLTPMTSRQHGRDPVKDLYWLRSYHALNAAGALLRTGPTGTNVMDVVAVHIASGLTSE